MRTNLFITGTDTDVGKTYVSARILRISDELGIKVSAFKPVASGACWRRGRLDNEDCSVLASVAGAGRFRTSYVFEPFVSPHIAANRLGSKVDQAKLDADLSVLKSLGAPTLVEGAGGWHAPVSDDLLYSQWVKRHQFDVVMVVAIKLGCINHSVLTFNAIKEAGLNFRGWYANFVDETLYCREQIESLTDLLGCEPLAQLSECLVDELPYSEAEKALLMSL